MKILVTGGAGFIGSHLCERLVNQGNEVTSLDNYFTGISTNHVEGVNYVNHSTVAISEYFDYDPVHRFDTIYHLGEYSRVEQSFDDMDLVLEYNKIGTMQVLEFARKYNCKLIYAGSSTKFGDNGPNSSPYAWSKASNTELVKNYGEWFGLDYCISYFFNVYGPREISFGKYATLIAKFNELYKAGEKFTVVSPGTQLRNFTHVDDTVDGLMLIGTHGSCDEYPIGNDRSYTILEIAEMFGGEIEMLPERKGNRLNATVDSSSTRGLGWCPKHNLRDYIEELKEQK